MIEREENAITTADIAEEARNGPAGTSMKRENEGHGPLFMESEAQDFRSKWERIQTAFVDEPRKAVKDADGLVAAAIKRLAEVFAEERSKLERDRDRGDNVSTEQLR
jgi:hypothetical protein